MTFTKFTHTIEILPSKLETQHEVHVTLRDYLFENVTIFLKDFSCGKICELKQVGDPACHSQNLLTRY